MFVFRLSTHFSIVVIDVFQCLLQGIAQRRMSTAENVVHNVCGTRRVGHQVVVRGHRGDKGKRQKEEGRKAIIRSGPSKSDREMKVILSRVEPIEPHPILTIFPYLLACYGHTFPGRVSEPA
jgi:hypothetical protein